MAQKAFKYRIYPTKAQEKVLSNILEECRYLYNQVLSYRRNAWEKEQRSVNLYETTSKLREWKTEHPCLNSVYAQVLLNVCVRVDLAYKAFFRRVRSGNNPGYPRFKGKGRYDSFTYPQFGFRLDGNKLRLSKVGTVKVKLHRPIEGKIKTCTIHRVDDKWFVCFSCMNILVHSLPTLEKAVGVDLGLISFATMSDGKKVDNPRFFRSEQGTLKKAQQRLSKAEKDTPERVKRRKVVSRIHEHINNKRSNFAHQLSRKLVNTYGIIVFEDLSIQQMLQIGSRSLSKSISDAAWDQLITYTIYKAEDAGRKVILVDPKNTSKICSRCGQIVEKELSNRVHSCPHCKLRIDRDWNAAINILRLGLQSHPRSPRL